MELGRPYRILSLDGGGALGVFTLGVLSELEKMIGSPLWKRVDLIYGTSTGSIIAALLALGHPVDHVYELYLERVSDIMRRSTLWTRSAALHRHAEDVFEKKKFDSFLVDVGIVATNLDSNRPLVFKSTAEGAHGRKASFCPGFGCTIADAVIASSAAYPMFRVKRISTTVHGELRAADGGFVASNPTLLALADALGPLEKARGDLGVLSVGTGSYPPKPSVYRLVKTLTTLMQSGSGAVDMIRKLLFGDVWTVRVDTKESSSRLKTNMLEHRTRVLRRVYQRGQDAFGENEEALAELFVGTERDGR